LNARIPKQRWLKRNAARGEGERLTELKKATAAPTEARDMNEIVEHEHREEIAGKKRPLLSFLKGR